MFFDALAWIFGVSSIVIIGIKIYAWYWYNFTKSGDIEKIRDRLSGGEYSFDIRINLIVAVICLSWIIFGN